MDSPLSGILPNLFLEFLDSYFKFIIPKYSIYFSYINDIFLISPRNIDVTKIMDKLTNIEPITDFTYELETKPPYLS